VEVDGGINEETIAEAARAGVDVCVAGTSVFRSKDAEKAILRLKEAAETGRGNGG
jgi:ribulose-phosphate 3-epimerase